MRKFHAKISAGCSPEADPSSQLCSEGLSLLQNSYVMSGGLWHSVPFLLLGLKQFWGRKSWQRRVRTRANSRNTFYHLFFKYCESQWCQLQKGKSLRFPFRKACKHVLGLYSWICRTTCGICILSAFLVQSQNSSSLVTFTQHVVTSLWIWWSNCGNFSFGMCLYLEKLNLELK